MNYLSFSRACIFIAGAAFSLTSISRAALLAYEPFTNAIGTAIIGSGGGLGFTNVWQSNGSAGVATNTSFSLGYTDAAGHTLVTAPGAGFFQGPTGAAGAMQPNRQFNFAIATNGEAATNWISFLIVRQGPTNGAVGNPYPRGVNVTFDYPTSSGGANQRIGIGNSSAAATNTLGLLSAGGNIRPSANPPYQFGGGYGSVSPITNFVLLRIDHIAGTALQANDNAYLWVNPTNLAIEPGLGSATTNVLGLYDYSIGLVRVFVGGLDAANSRPYGEAIVDEIRVGETFADVTPYTGGSIPPTTNTLLIITNVQLTAGNIVLRGTGGTNGVGYQLLGNTNLSTPSTNWPVLATNSFDANGNFALTNPVQVGAGAQFFRVRIPVAGVIVGPSIVSEPVSLVVTQGQAAAFSVTANGTAPLIYQWYFNTNTPLAGAASSNFTLAVPQTTDAGGYSVRISNAGGAVTSQVATLTVLLPPTITVQPSSQSLQVSNPVTFTVTAAGTAPLRYQWFFNTNTALPNATNFSYPIAAAQLSDGGAYSVRVTNNFGAVTSAFAVLNVFTSAPALANFYVATNGSDTNPGTNLAAPFKTIGKGLTAVGNGGLVYVRGGIYAGASKLSLNKTANPTNTLRLWAFPGENPVIDSTGNSSDGISLSGQWYHLKGLTVMNAGHNGINISGSSNIVEFCTVHDNGNTGLHITGGTSGTTFPAANLILNCDSYLNYDPPIGGNADGFTAKWNLGPGNVFSGCRAWWNSDDGWDFWMGDSPVTITNCWAFYNGTNYWNNPQFNGNGNGFKLGGNYVGSPHRLVRSVAFRNEANGVDQNNNISGQTIDNNTSWANKASNFQLNHGTNTTPHLVRNNLSFAAASSDSFTAGTVSSSNSWQVVSSPSANAADVQSVDESVAMQPRNADGSLPSSLFLRPVAGGRLIDKGVNIGEPYSGSAPDLGAYEVPP